MKQQVMYVLSVDIFTLDLTNFKDQGQGHAHLTVNILEMVIDMVNITIVIK